MEKILKIFDVRDTIVSFSLLQISNFFTQMSCGESIKIIACDDGVIEDLKYILGESDPAAVFSEKNPLKASAFSITLTKQH